MYCAVYLLIKSQNLQLGFYIVLKNSLEL